MSSNLPFFSSFCFVRLVFGAGSFFIFCIICLMYLGTSQYRSSCGLDSHFFYLMTIQQNYMFWDMVEWIPRVPRSAPNWEKGGGSISSSRRSRDSGGKCQWQGIPQNNDVDSAPKCHYSKQAEVSYQLVEIVSQPSTKGAERRAVVMALKRLGDGPRAYLLLLYAHHQSFTTVYKFWSQSLT